ncbi:GTP cyclohydrolase FolE2 [Tenuibacillus multivorans]|uniref:GTP cyclohydrolase FolE2 n=1 Tax=Tenuibacillus multivorans TaxID=237069 RepID=A0A1H0CIZ8_9BACI|nr:GTP cyclohydrolase FolE2 [Tenuibacillus multivorans]GEL76280.1 GTP cyclohydrolase FolE2 [Tenuibacillus multivorans]SDN57751.1 GTP cyclohydrolase I [Tenuibacillus multivorans]
MNETNSKKQLPPKEERHKLFGSVEPGPRTKPQDKDKMADLQNTKKDFLFELDAVGVSNVKHPIVVPSHVEPKEQTTIGTFYFASTISQGSKGTNMSRFTEQLQAYYNKGFRVDIETMKKFTKDLQERLKQKDAELTVEFPWFYQRKAPYTGNIGMNHADAWLKVKYHHENGYDIKVGLKAKITTLCPCSKEISEYSAHNQRGNVVIEITLDPEFDEDKQDWKELLLEAAESNASARIHPVLKRPDEKMVTEQAYENPRFVEDMVRLIASDLYELDMVKQFHVKCINEESIHLHDAIASITFDKREE